MIIFTLRHRETRENDEDSSKVNRNNICFDSRLIAFPALKGTSSR